MKIIRFIVVLLIIILVGAYLGRNFIVKNALEIGFKAATGLNMKVGKVNIDLKNTQIGINDLKIMNPKGFADPLMFSAPEIFVGVNLGDLFKKEVHVKDVRLNIAELDIVKNKEGALNLSALQVKGGGEKPPAQGTPAPTETKQGPSPIQKISIDSATLKVGKVVYKDYSQGTTPTVKEYNVNIDETVKNVTDVKALILTIFQKAMAKAAITDLVGANLQGLKSQVQKETQGALDNLKNQAQQLEKSFKLPSLK